ncbi:MAG: hypothetical protein ACI91Z_001070 [Yoonia sp.]|jgi:hypothetical protein
MSQYIATAILLGILAATVYGVWSVVRMFMIGSRSSPDPKTKQVISSNASFSDGNNTSNAYTYTKDPQAHARAMAPNKTRK